MLRLSTFNKKCVLIGFLNALIEGANLLFREGIPHAEDYVGKFFLADLWYVSWLSLRLWPCSLRSWFNWHRVDILAEYCLVTSLYVWIKSPLFLRSRSLGSCRALSRSSELRWRKVVGRRVAQRCTPSRSRMNADDCYY